MNTKLPLVIVLVLVIVAVSFMATKFLKQTQTQKPAAVGVTIGGFSMYPLYSDKDKTTMNTKFVDSDLQRGVVVAFNINDPKYPATSTVKRIIGVAGDTIKLQSQSIYLNGKVLNEPYLAKPLSTMPKAYLKENQQITILQGELFVLGDDRSRSYDSADFGPVKVTDVLGIIEK